MLSSEDREALIESLEDAPDRCGWRAGMDQDDYIELADEIAPAVEQIVARAVTAALNEAADELDRRALGGTHVAAGTPTSVSPRAATAARASTTHPPETHRARQARTSAGRVRCKTADQGADHASMAGRPLRTLQSKG